MNFETKIIDLILTYIRDNQDELCKPEGLPLLAKLGYIYNTLWYGGRICYGFDGILNKENSCEDNPKYKIEMCDPNCDEHDNLIYDAWGMHVGDYRPSWDEFSSIVLGAEKQLSELEQLSRKSNKTFEEWVTQMLHPDYPYKSIFPNKRAVANHLLCVIGTEMGYKDGFIYEEASGANQDISEYGLWENSVLPEEIVKLISNPVVKEVVDSAHDYFTKINAARQKKYYDLSEKAKFLTEERYNPYYPICEYSNISKFDRNTHPSYINVGIEVCEEIIKHHNEERPENVKFAEKFLAEFQI
jgi:hypothetical protein